MRTNTKKLKTRKIGGGVYTLSRSYDSRYDALETANNYRRRGRRARIIERCGVQKPYDLYLH
jgi:hypothetical protein